MSTPHNEAKLGAIAPLVLMPGDPLRAKFVAETFLENPVQFNHVRNMFGYTGSYHGVPVSVMGSGMGMPSIGIYSYELFKFYGVETIIRIGSAGSYIEDLKLYDVFLCSAAYSESSYALVQAGETANVIYPSASLNEHLSATAKRLEIPLKTGIVHSSDVFYKEAPANYFETIANEHHCEAVEMESFALFHNANVLGKKAACLLTISDSLVTHEATSAEERQNSFTKMMDLALEALISQ